MTYQALAILHEDGMLDIRWADDPTGDRPTAATVVALGDLLRDAAPYLPDADAATALIANMTVQGAFEPWAYTQIVATRQGEITFTASDQKAWYQALGAGETAAATQPSAPVPPPAASGASDPSLASPTVPTSAASPASAASSAVSVSAAGVVSCGWAASSCRSRWMVVKGLWRRLLRRRAKRVGWLAGGLSRAAGRRPWRGRGGWRRHRGRGRGSRR